MTVQTMLFGIGNSRRRGKGSAFYIAIGLCMAAVCLVVISAAINTRSAKLKKEQSVITNSEGDWSVDESVIEPVDDPVDLDKADTASDELYDQELYEENAEQLSDVNEGDGDSADTADTAELNVPEKDEPTVDKLVEENEPDVVAASGFVRPLSGEIIKPYSGIELVFCSTMSDWRVHEGVDIAAENGSEVKAAADGEVVDFVEDALYGYTAIIRQKDDSMLYYCGLSAERMVSAGLQVKAGDVIGHIGDVPCETKDGPHLHLALMKGGDFADPRTVLGS